MESYRYTLRASSLFLISFRFTVQQHTTHASQVTPPAWWVTETVAVYRLSLTPLSQSTHGTRAGGDSLLQRRTPIPLISEPPPIAVSFPLPPPPSPAVGAHEGYPPTHRLRGRCAQPRDMRRRRGQQRFEWPHTATAQARNHAQTAQIGRRWWRERELRVIGQPREERALRRPRVRLWSRARARGSPSPFTSLRRCWGSRSLARGAPRKLWAPRQEQPTGRHAGRVRREA